MTKRTLGFAVAAFALTMFLLAATMTFFTGNTQASAPPNGAPAAALPSNANAPVSVAQPGKPAQPNASVWSDIAPFPTVTIDFTPGPTALKLKRAGAAAYPPNGKIYVLGGRHGADGQDITLGRIFEYTPGNPGSWITKTALIDSNSAPGDRTSANMAVAVLTDSNGVRIYAIGGNDINSNPVGTVRIYNPVADSVVTLSTTNNWPAGGSNPAQHVPGGYAVYNNKLYIFGGFSALGSGAVFNDTWVYDPMAALGSQWRRISTANLSLARAYIAGAQLDGKIYAIGGDIWNSSTRQLIPQNIVEQFDPNNEAAGWTTVASLPTARGDMGAWAYNTGTGFEISGRVAVAGGVYPVPDDKGYLYNPSANSWSNFPTLVHSTRNYGVAQLNGFLYALGGYDFTNGFPDGANFNQRYDATGPVPTVTNTPATSPTATGTPFNNNYNMCSGTGTIDPGTTLVAGSSCDDCLVNVTLPFAYTLYDQTFTTAKLSSNGSLGFVQADVNPAASCLPDTAANSAIFGYWDDLTLTSAGQGIYTSVSGVAPNRVFNVEWRASLSSRIGSGTANFEIRLFEGQTQFEIVYGTVPVDVTHHFGTVGVQRDTGSLFTQYKCTGSAPDVTNGQKLTFTQSAGVCPTNTPTFTPSNTPTRTPTVTGTPPTSTSTSTPTNTPCGSASDYVVGQSTNTIVAGTTDTGNHCDDCMTAISLPFTYQLYATTFNSANLSSNGTLQFNSTNSSFSNACLPQNIFTDVILPFWDDLRTDGTGNGIFTSVSGVSPNRIFNIEWRATYFNGGAAVNFEARLYEGQLRFDVIYGAGVDGTSATVGVQKGTGTSFTQFECNTAGSLTSGMQVTFSIAPCITGTPFTNTPTITPGGPTFTRTNTPIFTATPTNTPVFTSTNTPVATNTPSGCGTSADYVISQSSGASIVAGTTDSGNHADDGITAIPIPFTFNFYGQPFTSVNASSNGNLQFSSADTSFTNACLPSTQNNLVAPFWDDLRTDQTGSCTNFTSGCGIFTSVSGVSPNRIFNLEWRAVYFANTANTANFEVRLYEGQSRIDFVYGATADSGTGATVGVQNGTGPQNTQFECNTGGLNSGLQLTFTQPPCGTATNTPTPLPPTSTRTSTPTPTVACSASTEDVVMPGDFFTPQNVTISVGDTVRWTNTDTDAHTTTSNDSIWNSGNMNQGDQFSFTFTAPGTYNYFCIYHSGMVGTINVVTGCLPTRTPTPRSFLVGHVIWQNIPQPNSRSQQPISLTLKLASSEVNYPIQNTDSSGFFTVEVSSLPAGIYNWRAKGPKWLANDGSLSLTGPGSTTQQEMGTMRAGDCNNDNVVNVQDSGILKNTYGKSQGDPGYDSRADFNADNAVTAVDFNMLKTNFGAAGGPPIGPGSR